jgi:hypothetical protein
VVGVVLGVVGLVTSLALLVSGAVLGALDRSAPRDGIVVASGSTLRSTGYAVAVEGIDLGDLDELGGLGELGGFRDWMNTKLDITVSNNSSGKPVFIGVAPAAEARSYLARTAYTQFEDIDGSRRTGIEHAGGAPATAPTEAMIWRYQSSGEPSRTLDWPLESGTWTVVIMNADGSRGVDVTATATTTLPPVLTRVVLVSVVAIGVCGLVISLLLIVLPIRRVRRAA